jgi:2-dehydro-3-deoxyphosphogluconate aldolase/(4S)-4-hydroxy-2-oxoglutarate aldolase
MTVTTAPVTAVATLDRLRAARAIAVVRGRTAAEALRIAGALDAAGLGALELTFTTPGVAEALALARRQYPKLLLGAGTITAEAQLVAAVDAGADFLVSPHLDPALHETALGTGRLVLPGVMTPGEVAAALRLGAIAVKLFPASTVGISHMRALFGPFPGLPVVPTGGITPAQAPEWLAAGAAAVGLGSELLPQALREAGDWDAITRNAVQLLTGLGVHRKEGR